MLMMMMMMMMLEVVLSDGQHRDEVVQPLDDLEERHCHGVAEKVGAAAAEGGYRGAAVQDLGVIPVGHAVERQRGGARPQRRPQRSPAFLLLTSHVRHWHRRRRRRRHIPLTKPILPNHKYEHTYIHTYSWPENSLTPPLLGRTPKTKHYVHTYMCVFWTLSNV